MGRDAGYWLVVGGLLLALASIARLCFWADGR